jgi:excisionase family DNA binding protein
MTRKEVAAERRVTEDTVTALVDKGDLPAYRFGGQLRYKRADVEAAFNPVATKALKNGAK